MANSIISPAAGEIPAGTEISITCSTVGAKIRYTADGLDPIETSTLYQGPFALYDPGAIVIKARGFKEGWTASAVASAAYTVGSAAPIPQTVLVGTGTFNNGTSDVTIFGFRVCRRAG